MGAIRASGAGTRSPAPFPHRCSPSRPAAIPSPEQLEGGSWRARSRGPAETGGGRTVAAPSSSPVRRARGAGQGQDALLTLRSRGGTQRCTEHARPCPLGKITRFHANRRAGTRTRNSRRHVRYRGAHRDRRLLASAAAPWQTTRSDPPGRAARPGKEGRRPHRPPSDPRPPVPFPRRPLTSGLRAPARPRCGGRRGGGEVVGRWRAPQNSSPPPPARTAGSPQTPLPAALYPPAAPTAAARCPKSTRRDSRPPPAPSALPPNPHPPTLTPQSPAPTASRAVSSPRATPPHLRQCKFRSPRPCPFRQSKPPPHPAVRPLQQYPAPQSNRRWNSPALPREAGDGLGAVWGAHGALRPCSSRDALKSEGRRWLKKEVFSPPSNRLGSRVTGMPELLARGRARPPPGLAAPLGKPVSG